MEITIVWLWITFMCIGILLMRISIRRNKNQIRLLKEEMAKAAEEAAREIVGRLFMGEDMQFAEVGIGSFVTSPSEAQEQVRKFVTKCIPEGIEDSRLIMGQIEGMNADYAKAIKFLESDEFTKILVAKINEYQLQ